jgi:hypothetical protein
MPYVLSHLADFSPGVLLCTLLYHLGYLSSMSVMLHSRCDANDAVFPLYRIWALVSSTKKLYMVSQTCDIVVGCVHFKIKHLPSRSMRSRKKQKQFLCLE